MKKFLNNIKQEAEHIRLSSAEKSAMRETLFGVPGIAPAEKSPYFFARYFSYNVRMSMAGLLLFVFAGAGSVSAAAQGALPGDPLYSVKVLINERAELALAPTSAAKAIVQGELAGRRVEEAQALATKGKLDAKTARKLSAAFDVHAAEALALAGPDDVSESATENAEVQTASAPALPARIESPKKAAPARTMMMRPMAVSATQEVSTTTEATTTLQEVPPPFAKKHRSERAALRASLEIKGELLKALQDRASKDNEPQTSGEEAQ